MLWLSAGTRSRTRAIGARRMGSPLPSVTGSSSTVGRCCPGHYTPAPGGHKLGPRASPRPARGTAKRCSVGSFPTTSVENLTTVRLNGQLISSKTRLSDPFRCEGVKLTLRSVFSGVRSCPRPESRRPASRKPGPGRFCPSGDDQRTLRFRSPQFADSRFSAGRDYGVTGSARIHVRPALPLPAGAVRGPAPRRLRRQPFQCDDPLAPPRRYPCR